MLSPMQLLALPASLLVLIATSQATVPPQELQWPYNLPPHVKYYPEDEALVRRDVNIQERLKTEPIAGVRKMSDDPGEKFFFDYWSFAPATDGSEHFPESCDESLENSVRLRPRHNNVSTLAILEPPFRLHLNQDISDLPTFPRYMRSALFGRSLFDKRGYSCPSGTAACTAIGAPDICCATDETCVTVQDTGLGTVGCCPNGETCGDSSPSECPSGDTPCPNNPGGGCCIPGNVCNDIGCVNTATVVVAPSAVSTSSSPPSASVSTTTVVVPAVGSTSTTATTPSTSISSSSRTTTTEIIPLISISTTTTTRSITTTSVSTTTTTKSTPSTSTTQDTCGNVSGYRSCPASLGGGCCPTNRACGTSGSCLAPSTTASALPPVRPTSAATTTTTDISSISGVGCPTGFYVCSAYYPGGCCQIGRDCDSTSCPAFASTTVLNSNSVTVVVPTGSDISAAAADGSGSCATGWFSCASTNGGGCCPSGFSCGPSCTATASGGQGTIVGKVAPSSAGLLQPEVGICLSWIIMVMAALAV